MSDSPNFLTYAQTAFDPFEERPFCAVDSLVFAWLSYLRLPGDTAELTNWQGLDVRELLRAECYRDMIDDLWDPEGSRALLEAVAANPRYATQNDESADSIRASRQQAVNRGTYAIRISLLIR